MEQYLSLCNEALRGTIKSNRNGDTIGYHGDMRKYDMSEGFPIVTTKELNFKSCIAEMLGFLKGYDNAADFRKLGSKVWDANANSNSQWLNNPHRRGVDDLGCIYGVQSRNWGWEEATGDLLSIDQLANAVNDLKQGIDNRREIVTHWNPSELDQMALPPCHLLYQFGIEGDKLNLSMYQRSCDLPLGVPFNITGYSWLLHVIAHITGLQPGTFTHFMHDIHIYLNQVRKLTYQLSRSPQPLPTLKIDSQIKTLEDLTNWATPDHFWLEGYSHHSALTYHFSV